MIRYGYAIRAGGDPEISGALRDGMERGTPARTLGERPYGETARRLAMMRHTPEEWRQMTEEARVIYGGRRYTPRWAERLLAGYALICYGVSLLYHAQDSMMGGGRADVW